MQLSLQSNQSVCETIPDIYLRSQRKSFLLQNYFYLRIRCVEGWGDRNLILSAGRDVESSLPHDWHVQVMNYCNLQTPTLLDFICLCIQSQMKLSTHECHSINVKQSKNF